MNPGGARPICNVDGERGLGCASEELRHPFSPLQVGWRSEGNRGGVTFQYDVRGEELQQSGEVTVSGCVQERVYHLPISLPLRIDRPWRRLRHFAACPRGELACGHRCLSQDFRDRGKVEPEAVVQDERNSLCWGQPIEQDVKGDTNRLGESYLLRRVGGSLDNLDVRFGDGDAGP